MCWISERRFAGGLGSGRADAAVLFPLRLRKTMHVIVFPPQDMQLSRCCRSISHFALQSIIARISYVSNMHAHRYHRGLLSDDAYDNEIEARMPDM
jgi:hypothetical protein